MIHYTDYGYRINQLTQGATYNWLFLPAGPGLGSDYLIEFCKKLNLPGSISVVDFPKDGTNTQGELSIQHWRLGLIDLLQSVQNPILVAHSFSGMFVMCFPEIEQYLTGLVLMNTTTRNSFFEQVSAMKEKHNLPDLVPAASQYHLQPNHDTYKEFWQTYKYYCFTAEEKAEGEKMISLLAFNNEAYHYMIEHFYEHYMCRWAPETIPTLTISSENDFICPPQIFLQDARFQRNNILNKLISKAGHCPWLLYLAEVQRCFDELANNFLH